MDLEAAVMVTEVSQVGDGPQVMVAVAAAVVVAAVALALLQVGLEQPTLAHAE